MFMNVRLILIHFLTLRNPQNQFVTFDLHAPIFVIIIISDVISD